MTGRAKRQAARSLDAMEWELGLYDWATLPCRGCWNAAHVPDELRRLALARTTDAAKPTGIEYHVFQETWATWTAVPVARVLMAGLTRRTLSLAARHAFLDLLWSFVVADDEEIAEACRDVVRTGLGTLYEEVFSGRAIGTAMFAYWLLDDVDEPARVERLLRDARHLLPEDLHPDPPDAAWPGPHPVRPRARHTR
ncbi:hypothetical protein CIB93_30160 [Streptomyces sp. WZ.A104]|uniref:hypothetical protein n=1 Tax=Streptomyces sp. WZ.A104 TaxID=2023771 RepID=UPI000BBC19C5|nr:hypothetical protein [Streptomyces sp. WZ.A104]PCG82424.1 hypothetical protein CIB93_30160 [Streptomyces sp. WZ.A104]